MARQGTASGRVSSFAQLQDASLNRQSFRARGSTGHSFNSLNNAQLQGASLQDAQLQGASLQQATCRRPIFQTRFSGAAIAASAEMFAAVKLPNSPDQWLPVINEGKALPWNDKAYHGLRDKLELLPPGRLRDQALDRIGSLDCTDPDKTLAPCDPLRYVASRSCGMAKIAGDARVDEQAYALALAKTLKELVCSGGDDAIDVLRGARFQSRLEAAGRAASDLIDDVMSNDSKDCPVPPR